MYFFSCGACDVAKKTKKPYISMLCAIFIIVTSPQNCDVPCVAVLVVSGEIKKGSASAGDLHRCRVFALVVVGIG